MCSSDLAGVKDLLSRRGLVRIAREAVRQPYAVRQWDWALLAEGVEGHGIAAAMSLIKVVTRLSSRARLRDSPME